MKYSALAILGLVSGKGETVNMQALPVFNQASFANHNILKSLLTAQTSLIDVTGDSGMVTYSQCEDDAGIFTMDDQQTINSPQPLTKGITMSFTVAGIISEHMDIKNIHVHVDWNGTPLYDEDHPQDNSYDDAYSYDLGWDVPGFAPNGLYHIEIKGIGSSSSATEGSNVYCVAAEFTF